MTARESISSRKLKKGDDGQGKHKLKSGERKLKEGERKLTARERFLKGTLK